jgi:two-component system, NarL family, nitrate/nitrite response regulator NarL
MMREALAGSVKMAWPDAMLIEAADFAIAWQKAATSEPDLILCDLGMPGAAPLDGIAQLLKIAPDIPLLVITALEDDATLLALFDLGISGFLPKKSSGRLIEAAINVVLSGGQYVPSRVLELASARGDSAGRSMPSPATGNAAHLTERQITVLNHMALGQTDKEIARVLAISPATVKAHAVAAFAALGASSRAEAVAKAMKMGALTF